MYSFDWKSMKESNWDKIVSSRSSLIEVNLREIIEYKDLLFLFVKRDIATTYKQTILGPLWFIIQPLFTTLIYVLVFSNFAKISTDNLPHILFYLSGISVWNYFSECLTKTSNTFNDNQGIFGKVYFPRVILPLSIVVSGMVKFLLQFTLFFIFAFPYYLKGVVHLSSVSLFLPLIILVIALIGLGVGMLFSSMTTKYRDIVFLLTFGIQLWMYATPVIYPLSIVPEKFKGILLLNPITPLVETVRYGFLGSGQFSTQSLAISFTFSVFIFTLGFLVFSRVERKFMDTI